MARAAVPRPSRRHQVCVQAKTKHPDYVSPSSFTASTELQRLEAYSTVGRTFWPDMQSFGAAALLLSPGPTRLGATACSFARPPTRLRHPPPATPPARSPRPPARPPPTAARPLSSCAGGARCAAEPEPAGRGGAQGGHPLALGAGRHHELPRQRRPIQGGAGWAAAAVGGRVEAAQSQHSSRPAGMHPATASPTPPAYLDQSFNGAAVVRFPPLAAAVWH